MHVHHSQITGVDAAKGHETARTEPQSKSGGVSFAEHLATASEKKSPKAPKGEKTAPVPGHSDYRDIVGGPRDGMYLNTSGNKRDGMAFVLVKRHGIEYHIYGTGKHRQVIEVKRHTHHHATPPASSAPTSGTTGTSSATQSTPTA